MIEFEEKMLSPTAFIQSTHNTVGAQIALLLKCHNYNNTIVHRAFSFENALIESRLLLEEGMGPVLLGAIDEFTDDRHAILSRFGLYRKRGKSSGNIAGEGSAFFLLDQEPGNNPLAVLRDVETINNQLNMGTVDQALRALLKKNELNLDSIDLVLTSHTGNKKLDETDDQLLESMFGDKTSFPYKSLCGDYPTASGFAVWLSTILMKEQRAPAWMPEIKFPLNNILIYNQNGQKNHGFILISTP
jgi:3-oxoacyl-(acyl-carrier-protein) synthase